MQEKNCIKTTYWHKINSSSQQGQLIAFALNELLLPLARFQDVSLQSARLVHGSPGRRRHFRDSSRLFLLPPCKAGNCQPQKCRAKPSSTSARSGPPPPLVHQQPGLLVVFSPTEVFCKGKLNALYILNSSYAEVSKIRA